MSLFYKRLVLQITYGVLFSIEFLKYILLLRNYGNIPLGEFPFPLCSMPLFLFPIVAWGKTKFTESFKPAVFLIGLLAGMITIFYPSNILGADYSYFSSAEMYFPLRSFVYHTIMIMFSVYMLVSGIYKFKKNDYFKALIVVYSLALVAIILNKLIPGADFFMLGKAYGSPFAFLIDINYWFYIFVMLLIASVLITAVFLPNEIIVRRKQRALAKEQ